MVSLGHPPGGEGKMGGDSNQGTHTKGLATSRRYGVQTRTARERVVACNDLVIAGNRHFYMQWDRLKDAEACIAGRQHAKIENNSLWAEHVRAADGGIWLKI